MKRCIQVAVGPGIFSCERSASFTVNDKYYTLLADASFFDGDLMQVRVIAIQGDQCLIDLPNETFTTGNRMYVPTVMLLDMSTALQTEEPSAKEIAKLAMAGGAFDWLADEPDLYDDTCGESA